MCCPMTHVQDNHPTKHRQHFATWNWDILLKSQQETRRPTSKPKQAPHKHNLRPTTIFLSTHSKPHRHHLHQRRTRTTGARCTIQHTAAPQDLLEQPHRRNWKGYKIIGHQSPRRLPPHGYEKNYSKYKILTKTSSTHTQNKTAYHKKTSNTNSQRTTP